MKKLLALVCAVMTVVLSLPMTAMAETVNPVTVTVDGKTVDCAAYGQDATIIEGRTLVPLRAIFEALGATVEWDQATKTSTSTLGDVTVSVTLNSNVMKKNGTDIEIDVPAQILNGRTLVPVRAIAQAFGCQVDWDAKTRTAIIQTKEYAEKAMWHDEEKGDLVYILDFETVGNDAFEGFVSSDSSANNAPLVKNMAKIAEKYASKLENAKLGIRTGSSAEIKEDSDGNKYLAVSCNGALSLIFNSFFVGNGTYTLEVECLNDTGRLGFSIHESGYATSLKSADKIIKKANVDGGYTKFTQTVDLTAADNFMRFYNSQNATYYQFDNIKVYYKAAPVSLNVYANGNPDVKDTPIEDVAQGQTVTVGELLKKIDMSASKTKLVGLSALPTGTVLPEDFVITVGADAKFYLIWENTEIPTSTPAEQLESTSKIKNIIFMIPDGAGYGSYDISNDIKVSGGIAKSKGTVLTEGPMALRYWHVGSAITLNAQGAVTDSAAAGTALSTGNKSVNGYLGLDADKRPVASLVDAAKLQGKATGLISNYEWVHATPASFAVHAINRSNYEDFFRQVENKGLDLVLGTGYTFSQYYDAPLKGTTIQRAIDNGYKIVANKDEVNAIQPGDKIWGNIGNLTDGKYFPYDLRLNKSQPTLAEMTKAAITALGADEDGFFLMVEGGKIDTSAHAGQLVTMAGEYLAFDEAFRVAVEYASGRDDTIVVAIPDHDTGGLRYDKFVSGGILGEMVDVVVGGGEPDNDEWTHGSHTEQNVPVWIYAPEGVELPEGLAEPSFDYYLNPKREENVVQNTVIAPWVASLIGADLDELTEELFEEVTDLGTYDAGRECFTFNNGTKYVYKDSDVYYEDGEEKAMPECGVCLYIEGRVYVHPAMVTDEDRENVSKNIVGMTGSGRADDPYVIANEYAFTQFISLVSSGTNFKGMHVIQTESLDLKKRGSFMGAVENASFAGTYDGQGNSIELKIEADSGNIFLFGNNDGTIMNLNFAGSISTKGNVSLVNSNNGKIVNCASTVDFTGKNTSGFAISNNGTIQNCYFAGTAVNAISGSSGTYKNVYALDGSGKINSTSVTKYDSTFDIASALNGGTADAASAAGVDADRLCAWIGFAGTNTAVFESKLPSVSEVTVDKDKISIGLGKSYKFRINVIGKNAPSQDVTVEFDPAPTSANTKVASDGTLTVGADEKNTSFVIIFKSALDGSKVAKCEVTVTIPLVPHE